MRRLIVMNQDPTVEPDGRRRDPLPRLFSAAALLVSIVALIFSMDGLAPAERANGHDAHAQRAASRKAEAKLKKQLASLKANCPVSNAISMGSWCLEGSTYKVPASETGMNNYIYATQKCVAEGG